MSEKIWRYTIRYTDVDNDRQIAFLSALLMGPFHALWHTTIQGPSEAGWARGGKHPQSTTDLCRIKSKSSPWNISCHSHHIFRPSYSSKPSHMDSGVVLCTSIGVKSFWRRINIFLQLWLWNTRNQDLWSCSRIQAVALWDEPNIELECQSVRRSQ